MTWLIVLIIIVALVCVAAWYISKQRKSNHIVDNAPILYMLIVGAGVMMYLVYLVGHFAGWWM